MAANKKTSAKAAKAASKVLQDGRTGKKSKTAAGSALSQTEKGKTKASKSKSKSKSKGK
jgi:hypothetical protein